MEYDSGKAARVWQRVQGEKKEGQPSPATENLPALIMEQLQLSNAYRLLADRMHGKDGAVLIRLAREANAQAVCMKGIVTLINGFAPRSAGAPQQQSNTDTVLRRCYGAELRLLKAYENRSGDAEYGPVFDRLAARGREHCCTLLELIGKMGKPQIR